MDWRNMKGQGLASGSGSRQPSRKQFTDSSPSDSKSTEASTGMSMDDLGAVDSASLPSTSRAAEVYIFVCLRVCVCHKRTRALESS